LTLADVVLADLELLAAALAEGRIEALDAPSLISLANFPDRGLRRNLEAGVLAEEETFSSRLSEQWMSLVQDGRMIAYCPGYQARGNCR